MGRILILGGGFGGVYTAMALEKLLGRLDRDDVEIGSSTARTTSSSSRCCRRSSRAASASSTSSARSAASARARICTCATSSAIDLERKRVVTLRRASGPRHSPLEYDHLVFALGNVTTSRAMRGLAEHALPFKYLGDALNLRNHVIHALEEAAIEPRPRAAPAAAHVRGRGRRLLGRRGGGRAERLRARGGARATATSIRARSGSILLHAGDLILPELRRVARALRAAPADASAGVEIRLQTRLAAAPRRRPRCSRAASASPRDAREHGPVGAASARRRARAAKKERGRIVVDTRTWQSPDTPDVWAAGRLRARCRRARRASRARPRRSTPRARRAAWRDNIVATLRGGAPARFDFKASARWARSGTVRRWPRSSASSSPGSSRGGSGARST